MFRTSNPVTAQDFFNRAQELADLTDRVRRLQEGAPSWVAILGHRKVGKTSLVLELARRTSSPSLVFVILDSFEVAVPTIDIIRRYALRVVDAVLSPELGLSLESLAADPAAYRAALQGSTAFLALPAATRAFLLELPDCGVDDHHLRACLQLPEQLAIGLKLHILVAWDEFQALAEIRPKKGQGDLLPLLRSIWQRHTRVSYFISGSERSMLTTLVTSRHSPFFQHFSLMELGGLPRADALRLLKTGGQPERPIPDPLAERAVDLLCGHPFYLQLLGEEITRMAPPYDEAAFKQALQSLLFSRTGRLALYFEGEYRARVGHSATLAATLQELATGNRRLGELAQAIGAKSGATVRYLERLGDSVTARPDGSYEVADPVFALWLRWRAPGGTVVPMTVLGDDAEREVADHLSRMGFDLVYQSRASRGAFDLLATRGAQQIGIQVKRASLPIRFDAAAWSRLIAEGQRFGWRWVIAVIPPGQKAVVLDPACARGQRSRTLSTAAIIDNLPLWLDRPSSA